MGNQFLGLARQKFYLNSKLMTRVRIATSDDAQAVLEIYRPYILTTAFTFEIEVPSIDEFAKRIDTYLQKYPWLICEIDNKIAGYAYASTHREREAYQWTCESSVYVHDNFKGRGIGKELYATLFAILQMQG